MEIGATLAMKEISPGRPTEPMLIAIATSPPTMMAPGESSTPNTLAQKNTTPRLATGLVMRNTATAIGSTRFTTRSGVPIASRERSTISGRDASEERLDIATASTGAVAFMNRAGFALPQMKANRKAIGTMAAVTPETSTM